jgi:Txe/YoeB family toxin of Txe-Axe toxin-antitoxin module
MRAQRSVQHARPITDEGWEDYQHGKDNDFAISEAVDKLLAEIVRTPFSALTVLACRYHY